jgi:hypothetical protein
MVEGSVPHEFAGTGRVRQHEITGETPFAHDAVQ